MERRQYIAKHADSKVIAALRVAAHSIPESSEFDQL
jgi:hypothetical protein